ncbi:kinase [Pasteurellaceae bacterium TAE3-ERU1]|nr:kinase [Pasteurellaceae bacterium TAE3-ERU1]
MMTLTAYIAQLRQQYADQRVVSFTFDGETYWLKQVERTRGAMRLLKGNPKQALATEIATLRRLNQLDVPCAHLVEAGDDYLVLSDVGDTVNHWLNRDDMADADKIALVAQCASALAALHQTGLVHGRPALRDMGYKKGKVRFIDFESALDQRKLERNKVRDLLVFLHDLYRSEQGSDAMLNAAVIAYRQGGGEQTYQRATALLQRWRWLYYLLKPTRSFAGKDLLSGLQLFDYFLKKDNA